MAEPEVGMGTDHSKEVTIAGIIEVEVEEEEMLKLHSLNLSMMALQPVRLPTSEDLIEQEVRFRMKEVEVEEVEGGEEEWDFKVIIRLR